MRPCGEDVEVESILPRAWASQLGRNSPQAQIPSHVHPEMEG